MDDFNTDLFSFISSMQEGGGSDRLDGGGTALTFEEKLETEVSMPSGPVSEAEVPPVSVAGVQKSLFRDAWCKAMDAESQGLKDSKTLTVIDKLPEGEKTVGSR